MRLSWVGTSASWVGVGATDRLLRHLPRDLRRCPGMNNSVIMYLMYLYQCIDLCLFYSKREFLIVCFLMNQIGKFFNNRCLKRFYFPFIHYDDILADGVPRVLSGMRCGGLRKRKLSHAQRQKLPGCRPFVKPLKPRLTRISSNRVPVVRFKAILRCSIYHVLPNIFCRIAIPIIRKIPQNDAFS